MIEIQNLTKRFGPILAVDGVSFEVQRGEVLGFLGPNGAGKSTTMKMVTGFLPPTQGTAKICGVDITTHPIQAKEQLGYLPEGAPAYPDMTPRGFLEFAAEVRGLRGAERRRRVDEAVGRLHLEGVLEQPIDTLSKGFKRRVGLAQAILHDPPVLIMDEPTDGLDPNQKHEVRALIRAMAPEKAIVLSTHILEEVDAVCTRAIIINKGRVVVDGTPADLLARSRAHNAVHLRLGAATVGSEERARAVERELAGLDGVQQVERAPGAQGGAQFVLYPRNGSSIVSAVSRRMRDSGWEVEELRVEEGRLNEVFRSLTTADVAVAQGGPA